MENKEQTLSDRQAHSCACGCRHYKEARIAGTVYMAYTDASGCRWFEDEHSDCCVKK